MKKGLILLAFLFLFSGCTTVKNEGALLPRKFDEIKLEEEASLFMVGDALLHGAVYKQVVTDEGNYDFSEMMQRLNEVSSGYDLKFYNQETILGGVELGLSTYPCFNSPQEFGDIMMSYGFNLVSLANNHTLDRGLKAIDASLAYWDKQDALTAGSYTSFEDRNEVKIESINGITYTLLAYTYGTNGIIVPEGKEYVVNVYTKQMIEEDVKRVRDQVDLVIVSMHWGVEYTHTPTQEQKEMAEFLADLGVDLVIGTHPHVIQPVEWIDDTLVYYSLGNLVSAQDGLMKTIGMMGAVTIEKTISSSGKEIKLKEPKADLIYTYYDTGYRNLHLVTFDELDDSYQPIYEDYTKIITEYDASIEVGGIY